LSISSTESPVHFPITQKVDDLAPSSNYCQMCHEYFKNYDLHVGQKTHLLRWQHNEFNQDIAQLCLKVQASPEETPLPPKHKGIRKQERKASDANGPKHSPKTTVQNYPKRKMSSLSHEASLNPPHHSETFHL